MATLPFSKPYYPDLDNISYEETAYFLYGIDTDKEEDKDEDKQSNRKS